MDKVRGLLFYDKRKAGFKGLCLSADVPELNLRRVDRVEPTCAMPDVAQAHTLRAPCEMLFWRGSEDSLTHHRNPLLCIEQGLTPARAFATDCLHCRSLGVFGSYVALVVHLLLAANVWMVVETTTDAIAAMSFQLLASELEAWHRSPGGASATRIDCIKHTMFGSRDALGCALRGSETKVVLQFTVSFLLENTKWQIIRR